MHQIDRIEQPYLCISLGNISTIYVIQIIPNVFLFLQNNSEDYKRFNAMRHPMITA